MKVLALLLLCAVVAVQGRSAGQTTAAALGDYPWLVHLRIAVSTSGTLNTGAGALISERWVLTSTDAVKDARFVWIRYGTVTVINPSLVTEASDVRNSEGAVSLININRNVLSTANISPVGLVGGSYPASAILALYGGDDDVPGEELQVITVTLVSEDDTLVATSDEGKATQFDSGAPLVSDGVVIGVLTQAGDDEQAGVFTKVSGYLDWIQEETGIVLCEEDEEEEGEEEEEQSFKVNFAN